MLLHQSPSQKGAALPSTGQAGLPRLAFPRHPSVFHCSLSRAGLSLAHSQGPSVKPLWAALVLSHTLSLICPWERVWKKALRGLFRSLDTSQETLQERNFPQPFPLPGARSDLVPPATRHAPWPSQECKGLCLCPATSTSACSCRVGPQCLPNDQWKLIHPNIR